jgi:transposase
MKTSQISQLNTQEIEGVFVQLTEQIAHLQQQLDWFKRQLFGQKSEKQLFDNPHQSTLFAGDVPEKSEPDTTDVKAHKRKSNTQRTGDEVNDSGLRFDETVPQKVIELPAPELQGDDADLYEIIGFKDTTRLAQQPGSYTVLIYRRPVVRHKANQTVNTPAAPTNVLDGCYADVSLLAGLLVDKAVYHLPLYRQHQRMLDAGVHVSRASLINWVQKAIDLLTPIAQAMKQHILQSNVLAMDEVPIKAGRKSKGKMKQTYFWPIYGELDEVAFTWSTSRGKQHAIDQLDGFNGTLLTDGYQAYTKAVTQLNEQDQEVIHAACWAHTRRAFDKALKTEPDEVQQALAYIGALYKIEDGLRQKQASAEQIQETRTKDSEPIVNDFFNWVYQQRQRPELLPTNPLSKALNYVAERQDELKVFLANPNVPLDTNHLERALRVIPMGRKNYLFCWSEIGAKQLGDLQSLMVTCRLQGVNPYHYLVDVLQRVSLHPAKDVLDLTPRVWKDKFQDNPMQSDIA